MSIDILPQDMLELIVARDLILFRILLLVGKWIQTPERIARWQMHFNYQCTFKNNLRTRRFNWKGIQRAIAKVMPGDTITYNLIETLGQRTVAVIGCEKITQVYIDVPEYLVQCEFRGLELSMYTEIRTNTVWGDDTHKEELFIKINKTSNIPEWRVFKKIVDEEVRSTITMSLVYQKGNVISCTVSAGGSAFHAHCWSQNSIIAMKEVLARPDNLDGAQEIGAAFNEFVNETDYGNITKVIRYPFLE